MKTILILVGKTTDKHFQAGINDYVERIGHYMPFELFTIPELKNTKSLSEEQCQMAGAEKKYSPPTDIRRWRTVWIFSCCLLSRKRADFTIKNDVFASDDSPGIHRADLPRLYHHQRRTIPSRVIRDRYNSERQRC